MIDNTLPTAVTGPASGGVREIKAVAMADALACGRAQYLSATIRDFVRYKGAWWLLDRELWFRADDEELITSLDAAAETMRMLDAKVRRRQR